MAGIKAPEQVDVILKTQEKTVRYAQNQIRDGDLLNGKSILDSALRQLQQQSWAELPSEFEERRIAIMRDIACILE